MINLKKQFYIEQLLYRSKMISVLALYLYKINLCYFCVNSICDSHQNLEIPSCICINILMTMILLSES